MRTNDNTDLLPTTSFAGPALKFDFPAFRIGVAEYAEGPTGCTVFHFPEGATTAIDIRGGTVGAIGNHDWNHAICLAGGSFYGLEAATGVAAELFAMSGYATGFQEIARVSGAVIYDYPPRDNVIYPDKRLGREAIRSARAGWFPLGARGAGRSATVGKGLRLDRAESSGQGGAFREVGSTKIAAFSVVSAIGAVIDRTGNVVRGHRDPKTGVRTHLITDVEEKVLRSEPSTAPRGNTTLTVVVTNQKFEPSSLNQIAKQVHGSMARAIYPFHTIYDGDVFYLVTTDEVENRLLNPIAFGVVTAEAVWDAVLSAVKVG